MRDAEAGATEAAGGPPPGITRVLETALYVDDLDRARDFYAGLGLRVMLDAERLVALDAGGGTVLLLFRRGASLDETGLPSHDGSGPVHIALAVPADALEAWREELERKAIDVVEERGWERGGTSLYFRDPDGHLVELATPGVWEVY